jgi:DNA polymerase III alpha subunit
MDTFVITQEWLAEHCMKSSVGTIFITADQAKAIGEYKDNGRSWLESGWFQRSIGKIITFEQKERFENKIYKSASKNKNKPFVTKTNKFGDIIFSEQDICNLYLKHPDIQIKEIFSDVEIHNTLGLTNFPKVKGYVEPNCSIEEYDEVKQNTWHMPDTYKNMDIAKWILEQCKDEAELQRAGQELLLFQEREMFPLLQYLKYLVDTMRQNNIVWGVGRGSSVASFVLYLIGIHKINSLYYDLPITEFIK